MEAVFGQKSDIAAWKKLVEQVSCEFPGLETAEAIEEHRLTVLRFMEKKQALCVKARDGSIAGVVLFSRNRNMICFLAVNPAHRRRGVAAALMEKALGELDSSRDITVTTFREGDEKGTAPRALYRRFGFEEGDLTEEFGYPNQIMVLRGKTKEYQQ